MPIDLYVRLHRSERFRSVRRPWHFFRLHSGRDGPSGDVLLTMSRDYVFPQFPRGSYKTISPVQPPELSPILLSDLAKLCRVESMYAKSVDENTWLRWIVADLERRLRAVKR